MNIQNATVLLTGANGGIGQAFISELLARGVAKIYAAVRNPATAELPKDPRVVPIRLDVTDPASIAEAVSQARDTNLLINNAGIAAFSGALTAPDLAAARQEMEVNYFGPLQLTRALKDTPVFTADGAIISVASFLSYVTLPAAGTYSASKAAVLALIRTMRAELKPKGTRVIAVLPVQTETKMATMMPDPKVQPSEVAIEALDALSSSLDEVYPGEPTKRAAAQYRADPAVLQAMLDQMVHPLA